MIKAITLVHPIASPEVFDKLSDLLLALGFEQGKDWKHEIGQGAAFLAPIGNLELITGRPPAVPRLLIETTELNHIHTAVYEWMLVNHRTELIPQLLSEPVPTDWNSRLFTVKLDESLTLGFWQSENPLHNKPVAIEGDLSAAGMSFAIVTTRWNTVITDRLLQGALDGLHRSGAAKHDIEIVRVPGAWEIPSAARTLALSGKYNAIITLGCLLRGETAHYEAIYNEVARGIGQSQQETGIPHAFGVLTCETLEQALDRAGLKAGNKGFEAAIAAIEMVSIQKKLSENNHKNNHKKVGH
jgi:6,7-dimethyl-8-ribityllumazine synthase